MDKKVLITGASGLIGKHLCTSLIQRGYKINVLTRNQKGEHQGICYYDWNIKNGQIDPACLDGVNAIIHLAGENIAARPWRHEQKQRIIKSRTDSIRLIYSLMKHRPHDVETLISASASGFYGDREDLILTETDQPGTDFMAQCCISWERVVSEAEGFGLRVVRLRTGTVLSGEGGALPPLAAPHKIGLGMPLGTGHQWMSWIHINDVINMYIHCLENDNCKGAYNMNAPHPLRNKDFSEELSSFFGHKTRLPRVPEWLLRTVLGEMHTLLTNSTRMHNSRIVETGFSFQYGNLEDALKNIYATGK